MTIKEACDVIRTDGKGIYPTCHDINGSCSSDCAFHEAEFGKESAKWNIRLLEPIYKIIQREHWWITLRKEA